MEGSLWAGALLALATSGVYGYVAMRLSRRDINGEAALAHRLFVVWWFGLAATSFINGAATLLYAMDALSVSFFQALRQLDLLVILAALWGLLFYLFYLYTGSRRVLVPLTAAYVALWLYMTWLYMARPFEALSDNGWMVTGEPVALGSPTATLVLLLGLIGPQIAAAIALLVLFFRVDGRTQKYRLGLVSSAIVLWFGVALIAGVAGWGELAWWPLFDRLIGLAAAGATLAAYHPPMFIQQRFGIESVEVRV